ncbi:MAG TPA: DNA mismatch repair endonuclease MutL, partial [Candidatus Acidoferrales bacterium]|nr:DNA mismatch repair endonuclease MutL [Candidatus Acidoferrales bacterium]
MAVGLSIRTLDPITIGQIAAGEIVERPASVVKELVENAIDAGATRITVAIAGGGVDSIEVVDDGEGIASGDLVLAVRRHATSKLVEAADLNAVATLGFRGEGLASIAAVSQLEVVSRRREDAIGARVSAHAEAVGAIEPEAAAVGTRVKARALFDNVPVRREYLRSPQTEFNRISAWLSSFALAYPSVAFTLRHDDRDVWIMPPARDPRERLAMVFGRDPAKSMLELDASAGRSLDGKLRGYVSAPGSDRADRRMQLLFVNGRLVRSAALAGAWTAGYATFAMLGRHPYGAIFLDLPPDQVDPNVHPTKSDVRFRHATQVFDAVRRAIAATLQADARSRMTAISPSFERGPIDAGVAHVASLFESAIPSVPDEVPGPRIRVLTQLHRTYILATDGDGLLLVDQHAAHERIAYERIVARAREPAPNEPLLVPITVELNAAESAALDASIGALEEGGLEIEPFGPRSYRIL